MTTSFRRAVATCALLISAGCFGAPKEAGVSSGGAPTSSSSAGASGSATRGSSGASSAATIAASGTTGAVGFASISGSNGTTVGPTTGNSGTTATFGTVATAASTGLGGITSGSNGTLGTNTGTAGTTATLGTAGTTATATGTDLGSTGSTGTGVGTIASSGSGTSSHTFAASSNTVGGSGTTEGVGTATATATSGTVGSSGSSATSISSGSSSSGSSGGNDCRTQGCPFGESCLSSPSAGGTLWLCSCTEATESSADTCTGNPNGDTICDPNTLQCGLPTDYDPCTPGSTSGGCAPGYTCLNNGEGGGTCLETCTTTSECNLSYAQCLSDGDGSVCQVDLCGPSSGPPVNGTYYGPCNLADAGDGTCQPFSDGAGGLIGYCMGSGPVATGGFCPGFGVDESEQCVSGDICFSFGLRFRDGGVADQCFQACDASAPGNPCPGTSACYANDPTAQTSPDPGYCFP